MTCYSLVYSMFIVFDHLSSVSGIFFSIFWEKHDRVSLLLWLVCLAAMQ